LTALNIVEKLVANFAPFDVAPAFEHSQASKEQNKNLSTKNFDVFQRKSRAIGPAFYPSR